MALSPEVGGRHSRVYLLRLWREHTAGPWRAAVRCAGSDDIVGFADLEDLLAFLQREIAARPGPGAVAHDE